MAETANTQGPETPETAEDANEESKPKSVYVAAGFMGLLVGFFALWSTLNMGSLSGFAFFIVGGLATWHLSKKRLASAALGTGCYMVAILMLLTPILFYLPNLLTESEQSGAEAAGAFIGSVAGLLIWGFVFFIFAVVTAIVGYFLRRRADKKLSAGEGAA
jgi:predicted lipid-binding transport protein (Tim44 family)